MWLNHFLLQNQILKEITSHPPTFLHAFSYRQRREKTIVGCQMSQLESQPSSEPAPAADCELTCSTPQETGATTASPTTERIDLTTEEDLDDYLSPEDCAILEAFCDAAEKGNALPEPLGSTPDPMERAMDPVQAPGASGPPRITCNYRTRPQKRARTCFNEGCTEGECNHDRGRYTPLNREFWEMAEGKEWV